VTVARLEIARRDGVLVGAPFGDAGAYERVVGVLHFEIDPSLPAPQRIADIRHAPRNHQGLVESSADVYLLRPLNGGNRRLLLDLSNRGVGLGMNMPSPTFERALDGASANLTSRPKGGICAVDVLC
jgi:hypothetical protein